MVRYVCPSLVSVKVPKAVSPATAPAIAAATAAVVSKSLRIGLILWVKGLIVLFLIAVFIVSLFHIIIQIKVWEVGDFPQ